MHPRTACWLAALAACAPEDPAAQATPAQRAVVEALSHRHGVDCAQAAARSDDPVADLTWVAERWPDPPWVGFRAAQCLAEIAEETAWGPTHARWVGDPAFAGLAEAGAVVRLQREAAR
jgi:hypothetical protein